MPPSSSTMGSLHFSLDRTSFPTITTRKALLVIDPQNDFLADSGALQVSDPEDLISKITLLSRAFRPKNDIVWIRTEHTLERIHHDGEIMISPTRTAAPGKSSRARGRGGIREPAPITDPEAFLGFQGPADLLCVRKGTDGAAYPSQIRDEIQKGDRQVTKTHYSAFSSGLLLPQLQTRFATELYVCGSLVNIGVFATVVDASQCGFQITIVQDCCGFRSPVRLSQAIKKLVEMTGCAVATLEEAINVLKPEMAEERKGGSDGDGEVEQQEGRDEGGSKGEEGPRQQSPSEEPNMDPRHPTKNRRAHGGGHGNSHILSGSMVSKNTTVATEAAKSGHEDQMARESGRHSSLPNISSLSLSNTSNRQPSGPSIPDSTATDDKLFSQTEEDSMNSVTSRDETSPIPAMAHNQTFCEGDTSIIHNLLPASLENGMFDKLQQEVAWKNMSHQGGEVPRLVAVQGEVDDKGNQPVYRHPSDSSPPLHPFTPAVLAIKEEAEKQLDHPLNHVLIQWYRTGNDYISEHSDKTLDIVPDTFIANVSLGAERTMVLRTKSEKEKGAPRRSARVALPHNSMFKMGLKTNMRWLHGIRQDKRADRDKLPTEVAFGGARISLTFRHIGTHMDASSRRIWGQGATGKTMDQAHEVVNGQTQAAIQMIKAFSTENRSNEFDWQRHYGSGSDVLHMHAPSRLFTGPDETANARVQMMLYRLGILASKGSIAASSSSAGEALLPTGAPIMFVDNDADHTAIEGEEAILLYLDAVHGHKAHPAASQETTSSLAHRGNAATARILQRFYEAFRLCTWWRQVCRLEEDSEKRLAKIRSALARWETYLEENDRVAGGGCESIADCAFWPTLDEIVADERGGEAVLAKFPRLSAYRGRLGPSLGVNEISEPGMKDRPKSRKEAQEDISDTSQDGKPGKGKKEGKQMKGKTIGTAGGRD